MTSLFKYIHYKRKRLIASKKNTQRTAYDILNVSMHKYSKATHFEYILSTCAVVHTEIEYIGLVLNVGTVR